jgi:acetylornithine deacetylase/succinyl-diaminopimelate desuccinylase-like protein
VTGQAPQIRQFHGGWVDAAELMREDARGFGTPSAITFGPGEFEQAHAVDEHIEIAEVAKAAAIYAQAARTMLQSE